MSVDDKNQASNVSERNELRKPTSQKIKAPAKEVSVKWLVTALLLLSAPPLAAGVFRLSVLASESEITLTNERFFAVTLPVVLHILCSIVYAILGAFQFATGFRRRRLGWHRAAGLLLVLCGLMVGISGLWMTLFYPRVDGTGEQLLYIFRLMFGSAMVVFILLAIAAIRRGKVVQHGAWMIRGYAIGLGAGTQMLTLLVGEIIAGPPSEVSEALLMGAGWVINLVVAEWVIRKRSAPRAGTISTDSSYQ